MADVNSSHTKKWVSSLCEHYELSLYSLAKAKDDWIDNLPVKFKSFKASDDLSRNKSDRKKLAYLKAVKELKQFSIEINPDIVHAHYATSYGMLAKKLKNKNTVISVWGSDILEFPKKSILHKLFLKRILKKAKIICSTSQLMGVELDALGFTNYKVIPFGVDEEKFKINSRSNPIFTVGTVKALEHIYGIDILLQVYKKYAEISEIESCLKIFGKGSELNKLQTIAKELGIENKVSFEGFVSQDKITSAYEQLDVYCAFSRRESFGVAILEAQSCELPVVCSKVGGLPEVSDPSSAKLFDLNQIQEAADYLKSLENKELRKQKGSEARTFVLNNYTWTQSVKKMREVYDSLV